MSVTPKVIVCEKSGRWATGLRWTGLLRELTILETRSLLDCRQELIQAPSSFLVLEALPSNVEGVLRLLWEVHAGYSLAAAVILASRESSNWENAFREASALHVAYSPRRLDIVVRLAERHMSRIPQPRLAERDAIWTRVPWGRKDE